MSSKWSEPLKIDTYITIFFINLVLTSVLVSLFIAGIQWLIRQISIILRIFKYPSKITKENIPTQTERMVLIIYVCNLTRISFETRFGKKRVFFFIRNRLKKLFFRFKQMFFSKFFSFQILFFHWFLLPTINQGWLI